ncbi:MAG: zinc-binding dehydrogenase [Candidatus Tectomicrobia bacterium]|nr:zinc-binding dehydrogenase [Candidatus Tectomicrobia bacterium]
MKAVVFHEYGPVDVLKYEEVPTPKPSSGEVLMRVRATALNQADLMARRGHPYRPNRSFPHVLGADIAGEIVELGPDVEGIGVGNPVIAYGTLSCGRCEFCAAGDTNICFRRGYLGAHEWGGYAQYMKLPAANAVPFDAARVSWEAAAAFNQVYLTAWHMLVTRAGLRPGEDVLIHAAGSGLGMAGLEIAKCTGARVFATAGSDEKCERARKMGADYVINYRKQDFAEEVRRLTGKRGVDLVFEHIGRDTWDGSVRSLVRRGRLVTCGGTSGYEVATSVAHIFHKELTLIGSNYGTLPEFRTLVRLLDRGVFHPVVQEVMPLREARRAHRILEERQAFGKLVLIPED